MPREASSPTPPERDLNSLKVKSHMDGTLLEDLIEAGLDSAGRYSENLTMNDVSSIMNLYPEALILPRSSSSQMLNLAP